MLWYSGIHGTLVYISQGRSPRVSNPTIVIAKKTVLLMDAFAIGLVKMFLLAPNQPTAITVVLE